MKSLPDWKKFEIIIAEIQKQLAPQAEVRHNHKIRGKSGSLRQFDVTVSEAVGLIPVTIVIECKHYKRKVTVDKVEAFSRKIRDVGASCGVMITTTDFDSGAKSIAQQDGIILLSYREAKEEDWAKLVGPGAWLTFVARGGDFEMARIEFDDDGQEDVPISGDEQVFLSGDGDDKYRPIGTVEQIFLNLPVTVQPEIPIGPVEGRVELLLPLFLDVAGKWKRIKSFHFKMKIVAKAFALNLRLAGGSVLEDVPSGRTRVVHAVSEGFDWAEVLRTQLGTELTEEQFQQLKDAPGIEFPVIDLTEAKQYFRVVLTHKQK